MTTTRTLQFFGQAYGDTPVTLVASINGTELFNGTVSTIVGTAPLGLETADQVLLFTVSFPGDAAAVSYTHLTLPTTERV